MQLIISISDISSPSAFSILQRYMAASDIIKIGARGGYGAQDYGLDPSCAVSYITKVKLYTGEIVDCLEISYVDDHDQAIIYGAGGPGGGAHEIPLESGEYINRVVGSFKDYYGEICIAELGFETNLGNEHGPFGQGGGEEFTVEVNAGQIFGFFGQSDRYINSIGFYLRGAVNSVTVSFE